MNRRRLLKLTCTWSGCALVGVSLAGRLHSQHPQGESVILFKAVQQVQALLRNEQPAEGVLQVDDRELVPQPFVPESDTTVHTVYRLGRTRNNAVTTELLRLLPAEPGKLDSATVCSPLPRRRCRMRDAVAVFAVSAPHYRVADSTEAEVVVAARWASRDRDQQFHAGRFAVVLIHEPDGWKVRSVRTLAIS